MKILDNFAVFRYKRSKSGYLIDVVLCSIGLRDSTHSYVLSRKKLFLEKSEVQLFLTTCSVDNISISEALDELFLRFRSHNRFKRILQFYI